jgi:hypothetical protein
MRVSTVREGRRLSFVLTPADDDPTERPAARMVAHRAEVVLPEEIPAPHPDLVALAALLVGGGFVGRTLTVDQPVSAQFAAAVLASSGTEVGPVGDVAPRTPPAGGRPGLCFSGGVDSTAALSVLPAETELFFLERIPQPGKDWTSMYRKEAALESCRAAREDGWTVHAVQTDVEYLRDPVGFPVDLSNGLPAVLLADARGLDALTWGTIAESAYRLGGAAYDDYGTRAAYTRFAAIFAAVGLPILNVVAGVSEVGTSLIVLNSPHGSAAQSCMRGGVGAPCRRCWKCFRKSLLDASFTGAWPDDTELDRMFTLKEPRKFLHKVPVKHEDVLTFLTSKYTGSHPLMLALRRRVGGDRVDVDWLTRYYRPSLDLLPEKYRADVEQRLRRYMEPMTPAEEEQFRAWVPVSSRGEAGQAERNAEFDRLADAHLERMAPPPAPVTPAPVREPAAPAGLAGALRSARRFAWRVKQRVGR